MKIPIVLLFLGVLFPALAAADSPENHEFIYGYLAGNYVVIGKTLEGNQTYYGKVRLVHKEDYLEVTRVINGLSVVGTGRIEHALGSDEAHVLRVRFDQQEINYEITYLWQSDLDNYPRISGYLYRPGVKADSPGLEVLFIDHQPVVKPDGNL